MEPSRRALDQDEAATSLHTEQATGDTDINDTTGDTDDCVGSLTSNVPCAIESGHVADKCCVSSAEVGVSCHDEDKCSAEVGVSSGHDDKCSAEVGVSSHDDGCGHVTDKCSAEVGVSIDDGCGHVTDKCSVSSAEVIPEGQGSIYLSDGVEMEKKSEAPPAPPKRMTMAQRAAMEALASFGGSNLGSIPVRKIDLRKQLKREAEKMKEGEKEGKVEGAPQPKRPRTRLQAARDRSECTALGEDTKKKYPKIVIAKRNAKKSGSSSKPNSDSSRQYKLTSMKELKAKAATASVQVHRPTRVEKARLEALESFGRSSLSNVLSGATRKVARTLEQHKPAPAKGDKKGVVTDQTCDAVGESVEKENAAATE